MPVPILAQAKHITWLAPCPLHLLQAQTSQQLPMRCALPFGMLARAAMLWSNSPISRFLSLFSAMLWKAPRSALCHSQPPRHRRPPRLPCHSRLRRQVSKSLHLLNRSQHALLLLGVELQLPHCAAASEPFVASAATSMPLSKQPRMPRCRGPAVAQDVLAVRVELHSKQDTSCHGGSSQQAAQNGREPESQGGSGGAGV